MTASPVVDADIASATITNDKLATISSTGVQGSIVVLNGSGNFTANEITITGTPTFATDAATKAYVDAAVATGLVAKTPAEVVCTILPQVDCQQLMVLRFLRVLVLVLIRYF